MELSIQERLKDLRVERGLTLEQLAEQTHLSKSALGSYEGDKFKDISHYALIELAKFYEVTVDYLLGRSQTKNHPNADLADLRLSDDMIELLKSGRVDNSLLCELAQYDVSEEALEELTEKVGEDSLLGLKLHDIRLVYQAFTERMGDTYMMAEELVPQLTRVVSSLEMMKHCVVCLDGFTGFTPTQYELLREILGVCEDMYITVTTDRTGHRDRVFSMSADTIRRLTQMAGERGVLVEEPVITGAGREKIPYRVAKNEELAFMEERLFTHGFKPWEKVPESIHITMCHRERDEVSYVARRIYWLMKEEGYEPEDIAVVTADEAAYEPLLVQEFEKLGIRYFLDSTKSIGANAMAEYLLAFIHMVQQRLDYESTFRFLRCALSPLTREQTDCLENYVIARGCRGMAAYQSEWEYAVSGLDLLEVNEYRRIFVNSIAETLQALKGGKKSVREFTEIFYGFAEKNGIYERLLAMSENFENDGKLILAREYKSIYRLMIHLWDEFVELLGDEIVTFKEYTQMLEAGISEGIVGFIPPTAKQVMIGDVTRSRLKNIKVLFFLGVNDGVDCFIQQFGEFCHVPAVIGFCVEFTAEFCQGFTLATAKQSHIIKQFLRVQIIADDFSVHTDINHIERMDAVLIINVHALVDVLQHEDDALRQLIGSRNNSMETTRLFIHITVVLYIFEQIKAEFIQSQVHNGDARCHILNVYNFILQALELRLSVLKVCLFLVTEQIIIARSGHDRDLHSGFHTVFQIDVLIQIHIRPEVHQLDIPVLATDTVDTPKALDDAHRVPMNIIVYQIVAVLQVLTFRNTICSDQNINISCAVWHKHRFALADG